MIVGEQSVDEIKIDTTEKKETNEVVESLNSTETLDSELTENENSELLETSEDAHDDVPENIDDIEDVILEINISKPIIFDYEKTLTEHFINLNQTDDNDLSLLANEIDRWQTGEGGSSSAAEEEGEESGDSGDSEDSDPEEDKLSENGETPKEAPEEDKLPEKVQAPQRAKRREKYNTNDDFVDDSEAPKSHELAEKELNSLNIEKFTIKSVQGAFRKLTLKKGARVSVSRQRAKPKSQIANQKVPGSNPITNGSSKAVKDKRPKQLNSLPSTSADQGKKSIAINESGSDELSDLTTWTPSPPPHPAIHHSSSIENLMVPSRRGPSPSFPDRDDNNSKTLNKSKKPRTSNLQASVLTGPAKRKATSNSFLVIQSAGKPPKMSIPNSGPNLLNSSDSDTSTLSDLSSKDVKSPATSSHNSHILEPLNSKATPARSNRMRTNRTKTSSSVPNQPTPSIPNVDNHNITRLSPHAHSIQNSYSQLPNPIQASPSINNNFPSTYNNLTQTPNIKDSNSPDRRQKLSSIAHLLSDPPEDTQRNQQQTFKSSFVKSVQSSIEYMLNDPNSNLPPSIQNQVQESIPEHGEYRISSTVQNLINTGNLLNQQNSSINYQSNIPGNDLTPPNSNLNLNLNPDVQNFPLIVVPSNSNENSVSPVKPRSQPQISSTDVKPSPTKKTRKTTTKTSRLTRSNSKKVAQGSQIYTYIISDED